MVYNIQYKDDHNFISLQTLALIPKNKSIFGKAYISIKSISYTFMVYQDI